MKNFAIDTYSDTLFEGFSGWFRLTFFATTYCGGCFVACGDTAIEGSWAGSRSGDFG
jgi:hypothetical protein